MHGIISSNSIPDLGYALNIPAGAKIALPVDQNSLVYSHLKHISGIPAPEGSPGVTISKLNILDILIDQMNQFSKADPLQDKNIPENRLDAMIDSYRTQIRIASETNNNQPYAKIPSAESGLLFEFTV